MNENALYGIRCPKCRALEPFDISATTIARFWDEGGPDPATAWDLEYDDKSWISCVSCGHEGVIRDFQEELSEDHSEPSTATCNLGERGLLS